MRRVLHKKGGLRKARLFFDLCSNLELSNLDVLVPHFVGVIGQHDVAFSWGKAGFVFEFAGGDHGFPFIGLGVGFTDEHAIQPMLDFTFPDDDAAGVPFTHGFEGFVRGWLLDVVNGSGGVATAFESIRVFVIVDHLVLDAEPLFAADFGGPILHAIVAAFFDLPVPFELELAVFFV